MTSSGLTFHVLGPLEVRVRNEQLLVGGAKQQAVLAALLLRAGEVVSVERLVDEVWGDNPPPSAAHTLESYVSRLRQLLNGHGPRLVRRGAGYALELAGAALDARAFVDLQERASLAAAMDEQADALELTAAALAMWRGPALADVALASAGRAEADRLEELRLRTYELRFEAELALGRHEQAIGELQVLVGQNPYRERFVAQLMLALYRAGRHAEALDTYERMRKRLDDDLGLQPSVELQQLSGQIVRQDPQLRRPTQAVHHSPRENRFGRVATLVAGGLAAAAVMSLTASGGTTPTTDRSTASATGRVALLVPRDPARAGKDDPMVHWGASGFRSSIEQGQQTETVVLDGRADSRPILRDIEAGDFDLVVVLGDTTAPTALLARVPDLDSTRFVFIGARLADLGLAGVPNASGYPFADQNSAQLAGYLGGLVPPRGGPARARADIVGVVVGARTPLSQRVVVGFRRGLGRALPKTLLRVAYAPRNTRTDCERIANEQITAGADAVLGIGRPCGRAVAAVARVHGVWALAVEDDGVEQGPHVLVSTYRNWEPPVFRAISDYRFHTLRPGRDVEFGLADDYAVGVDSNDAAVPETIWERVVRLCSSIRQHEKNDLS